MSRLETITRGKRVRPPRILVYGMEGIGKSTFAANFPAPVFIPTEDGLDNIDVASFPLVTSIEEVFEDLDALVLEENDFQTIVIDSLDWLERLIWNKVATDNKVDNIEKIGYGKGYTMALSHWQSVIDRLEVLHGKGRAILLLAHAVAEDYTDPEVSNLKRFTPRLNKLARSLFMEYVDVTLLATRRLGAARGDSERIVRTEAAPQQVAKSRYPIPDVLPLDAAAVLTAIRNSQNS